MSIPNEDVRESSEVLPFRAAVPTKFSELSRKGRPPTINALVEMELEKGVWNDPKFQGFISAVYTEETREGSKHADDLEAAAMIRASAADGSPLRDKTKEAIRKALNDVLKKFGQRRIDRLREYESGFGPAQIEGRD